MNSLAASATPLILSIPSEAYPSSRHELWDDPRTDLNAECVGRKRPFVHDSRRWESGDT